MHRGQELSIQGPSRDLKHRTVHATIARVHHPRRSKLISNFKPAKFRQLRAGAHTQYRTRARAQKKTVAETTPERLPQAAAATYEALRAEVLSGKARLEGVAALRFHGMVQGLALLLKAAAQPVALIPKLESAKPVQRDSEFVRVLANIVLRTHSELAHVY